MDAPISRATPTTAQYYHQDGIGSVVGISDQNGATTATAHYDTYGNRTALTGSIPQYGYTGREPDETGLVYYRSRYYDPAIGRFAQRDPIEFQGGLNLYAYAGGNPVNFTDPMGTIPQSPTVQSPINVADYSGSDSAMDSSGSGGMSDRSQNLAAVNPPPADTASIIQQAGAGPQGPTGPNFLQRVIETVGDVLGKIWALPLTAVNAAIGIVGFAAQLPIAALTDAPWPKISISDNSINFLNNPLIRPGREFTLGNVANYAWNNNPDTRIDAPYTPGYQEIRLGTHASAHTYQSQYGGIFFALSWLMEGMASANNRWETQADSFALGRSNSAISASQ